MPVVIEKLDGPALAGKITDKTGFDRVVAESSTLHDTVIAAANDFGLEEERVECIFPGIDLEVFNPGRYDRAAERAALGIGRDEFVVGTVCQLIPDKNVKLLVRSFAAMSCDVTSTTARLLVVGPDGGSLADLHPLADELAVTDRVMFVPTTDRVAEILSTMDVFAMTSLREGRFAIRNSVHSHFHPNREADKLYAALAAELPNYHAHPKLNHREKMILSRAMSAYDLMGVFHELDAAVANESRTLEVCIPTKAVCGWLLVGIPVVCVPHYRGLVEWINGYGMGFVVPDVKDVGSLAGRRDDIRRATRACLEHRHLLTHETQALRISGFYSTQLAKRSV